MIKKRDVLRIGKVGVAICMVTITAFLQSNTVQAVKSVTQIQNEKSELQEELSALDSDLVAIVSEMAGLQSEIDEIQQEIADTEIELENAQAAADNQYAAMKIRIQFMYENSGENVFSILLESGSNTDFLNRMEYVNSVYTYDKEMLDNYEATVQEISYMKEELDAQAAELASAKASMQAEEANLQSMIASKKGKIKDLDSQLKQAQELAARQAAAQAQAAQSAQATTARTSSQSSENVNGNLNPGSSGNGSAIVAFANQFVGCPYTWGGTDPANGGADCSGFVSYVFRNFGLLSGRYTSYGLRSVGSEVSYQNLQAGDIVCYPGHVGIYTGNGTIVEAQDSAHGITNYRSVNCGKIITIRRL